MYMNIFMVCAMYAVSPVNFDEGIGTRLFEQKRIAFSENLNGFVYIAGSRGNYTVIKKLDDKPDIDILWGLGFSDCDSNVISDLMISPDAKHIAFIEDCIKGPPTTEQMHTFFLRILTVEGKEVVSIENGVKYAWSPDGEDIAFIRGTYRDAGFGFSSMGMAIWNKSTQEIVDLDAGYPYALHWASFDEHLYIKGIGVMRVDIEERSAEPTPLLDIDFSPDGKHYLRFQKALPPYTLYTTETNQPVDKGPVAEALMDILNYYYYVCWLNAENLILYDFQVRTDPWNCYVLNIENAELRKSPHPIAAVKDPSKGIVFLITSPAPTFETMSIAEMPIFRAGVNGLDK